MPLPNAKPDPEDSNVYKQLSTIKAGDLTRSQLDVLRDPLFLNDQSEDVLRRIALIGAVTDQLSSSGPIPNTGRIQTATTNVDATLTLFQPAAGEVWQLTAADATAVGGGIRFKFQLHDGSNVVEIKDQSVTGATDPVDLTTVPLFIDNNVYLKVNISSISGSEVGTVHASFIRIR